MSGNPRYEIYVQTHFSAAHHLRGYPGECEKPHGHNWIVDVYVLCEELNEVGIGIDFKDIKASVKEVLKNLDHTDLNELPEFQNENPSSENIAAYLYRELSRKLNSGQVHISKVRVCETPGSGAFYWEE
ncbi:MAG: 6-carboxytetrahydropterin synthase QueD [Acidobacteriota bacterium]|nr:MAG: 6-carboxytetrahydropterin synthase QueD [Acidobacteriota bacterium]